MKYPVAFFIFALPFVTSAQTNYYGKDSIIINDLKNSWSLGIDENGAEPIDIRVFNEFKALFLPDATIDDEIDAVYKPASARDEQPYKTRTKSFEYYAHDIALHFKNFKVDSVYNAGNPEKINDSTFSIKIRRKLSGEKYRQYVFDDIDSLVEDIIRFKNAAHKIEEVDAAAIRHVISGRINDRENRTYKFESVDTIKVIMVVMNDTTIKLSSIKNESKGYNLKVLNDKDYDGIINEEDSCSDTKGDFTANGCIDSDLDGIADDDDACKYIYGDPKNGGCPQNYFASKWTLSVFAGMQLNNAALNMPGIDKSGYGKIDFNESETGRLKNPGFILSPAIGFDETIFFGRRKKRTGISFGLTYTSFSADYKITQPVIYTFKANDGVDDYRRRITIEPGSEEIIDYRVINIPVLLRYKVMMTKIKSSEYKWTMEFCAGPSLILFINNPGFNMNIDFEGLYQVDTVKGDAITYYNYFDPGSHWNVSLTGNDINGQSLVPGTDAVFNELNKSNYDFAQNKNYQGTAGAERNGIAFNFCFNGCYKINSKLQFRIGASLVVAPITNNSGGYKPIDKTTDTFYSIYNSKAKATYSAYGLNAGIVIGLR